jgi:hypothetical protein
MSDLGTQEKIIYNSRTQEVVVRRKVTNGLRTPFSAVAPFTNRKRRSKNMNVEVFDLLDLLEKVSKGAFCVFNNLKYNRLEDNNITQYVATEELNKTDKESLSRRLKELRDVDLIRRVRKHIQFPDHRAFTFAEYRTTFIINPEMLRCRHHDEAAYLWNVCGKEEQTDGTAVADEESD